MSLRSFHIFFMTVALSFLAFLFYWSGRRYVQLGSRRDLPLALCSVAGLALGGSYLYWFIKKGATKASG